MRIDLRARMDVVTKFLAGTSDRLVLEKVLRGVRGTRCRRGVDM